LTQQKKFNNNRLQVGASGLRYRIGQVKYNVAEEDLISSEVIGAISAVTAILISVGIVVLVTIIYFVTNTPDK
jgi:hypothetical protein